MEELTIEQKAKRYDEALNRAKGLYAKGAPDSLHLEEMFPELKEPDDEEIRKLIISLIEWSKSYAVSGITTDEANEMLAWLEKEGKQKYVNFDEAEKEKSDFVGDGFIKCYANFQDFKEGETYWLEYMGNDNYNVRSDNLLGKTYHITPCQLYTIFKKQTWLEKQGEHEYTLKSSNNEDVSKLTDQITKLAKDYELNLPNRSYDIYAFAKDILAWLERQNKNVQGKSAFEAIKEETVDNANKVEPKFKIGDKIIEKDFDECDCGTIIDIKDGKYIFGDGSFIWIKEQGLWELVEKTEPKFKDGDWIVYKDAVWKVCNIDLQNYYDLLKINNEVSTRLIKDVDKEAHLWTINDAKPGDIIYAESKFNTFNFIAIFSEIKNKNSWEYCSVDSVSDDYSDDLECWEFDRARGFVALDKYNFYPATKKQRHLLYQKMKEAGYEWDAEKKELKKI